MIKRSPRREHYTVIDNLVLQDARLSWKARGILCYVLSMRDDWEVSMKQLAQASPKEGGHALHTALQELVACGYATLEQQRTPDGRRAAGRHYVISEVSRPETMGSLNTGKPELQKSLTSEKAELQKTLKSGKPESQVSPVINKDLRGNNKDLREENKDLRGLKPYIHEENSTSARQKKHETHATPYSAGFQAWWQAYPPQRRLSKPACFRVWQTHGLEARTLELLEKLERLKETTWKHCEPHHIKTSLPYLNSGRYDDDLVPLPEIPPIEETGLSQIGYENAKASMRVLERILREENNNAHDY